MIAAQPTSKSHPPHPIFIRTTWTTCTHNLTYSPLTPSLYRWTTCTYILTYTPLPKSPHLCRGGPHVQVHTSPPHPVQYMNVHPSNPPYSAALHAFKHQRESENVTICKFVVPYTYLQWPRSCFGGSQIGLKKGSKEVTDLTADNPHLWMCTPSSFWESQN